MAVICCSIGTIVAQGLLVGKGKTKTKTEATTRPPPFALHHALTDAQRGHLRLDQTTFKEVAVEMDFDQMGITDAKEIWRREEPMMERGNGYVGEVKQQTLHQGSLRNQKPFQSE